MSSEGLTFSLTSIFCHVSLQALNWPRDFRTHLNFCWLVAVRYKFAVTPDHNSFFSLQRVLVVSSHLWSTGSLPMQEQTQKSFA